MKERELTKTDRATLKRLNQEVKDAVDARRKWLDARIAEYAVIPIKGNIYDLDTGELVGRVIEHNRRRPHNGDQLDDTYLSIVYWYTAGGTSRGATDRPGRFGDRQERDAELQKKLDMPKKKGDTP